MEVVACMEGATAAMVIDMFARAIEVVRREDDLVAEVVPAATLPVVIEEDPDAGAEGGDIMVDLVTLVVRDSFPSRDRVVVAVASVLLTSVPELGCFEGFPGDEADGDVATAAVEERCGTIIIVVVALVAAALVLFVDAPVGEEKGPPAKSERAIPVAEVDDSIEAGDS